MKLSQEEIGQTLQFNQSSVARIEKRADMYVSTLRRFIEAMGGEPEIRALSRPCGQDQELLGPVGKGVRLNRPMVHLG